MLGKTIKSIALLLCLFLTIGGLSACVDFSESNNSAVAGTDMTVLQFFEALQDNDIVPFVLTDKAKIMLSEKEDLFLKNSADGLDRYTDTFLDYKVLTKNIDKHGDQLIYLAQTYVLSIDETQLDEETTFSEVHLMDADGNSFYVLSLTAYDGIFEGDVVKAYALPLGKTAFENVSGGTTLAIVLAGCYLEEIPV